MECSKKVIGKAVQDKGFAESQPVDIHHFYVTFVTVTSGRGLTRKR